MLTHEIIIITKDREQEIYSLLDSLTHQMCIPQKITVIDASLENTLRTKVIEYTKQYPAISFHYLHSDSNISKQKNIGLEHASESIVTFFDDDILLDKNYCEKILKRFEEDMHRQIGAIGGKLVNPRVRNLFETMVRKFFFVQTDRGSNTFLRSGFPDYSYDFTEETKVDFISSGALSIRSEALGEMRFEEYYFTGQAMNLNTGRGFGEDILFTSQLATQWDLIIIPDAQYYHHPSPKNRETIYVTQSLYIYSLRYLSKLHAPKSINKILRYWALFGQGIICLMQTIVFISTGYLKGYFKAMKTKLPPHQRVMNFKPIVH